MNWIPYGPNAWLLRFADRLGDDTFASGRAIAAELERHPPAGLAEFVSGFSTVLLEFHPDAPAVTSPGALNQLRDRLRAAIAHPPAASEVTEIPVIYDGPDVARVAEAHGLTPDDVARLHSGRVYKVYLLGFSPDFPYLGDLDPRLHTPRLSSPRPRVAAGSVAIGGEHTGIYTVDSPGGWNIIGRTTAQLFDPRRRGGEGKVSGNRAMFLLQPGDQVRFVPATDSAPGRSPS